MVRVWFMALLMLGCLACGEKGCSGQGKEPAGRLESSVDCRLVRVFGVLPLWHGRCSGEDACWRQLRSRLRWVRCIEGRCLMGQGDEGKGHLFGIKSLSLGGGGRLATGDAGGWIRLWDVESGQTRQRWKAQEGEVRALRWVSRSLLLSGGDGGKVLLWSVSARRVSFVRGWTVSGRISDLAISKTHGVAAASTDRTIWMGKLSQRKWRRLRGHVDAVRSVAFSPQGKWLASASDDRSILLWSLLPGGSVGETPMRLSGHVGWVRRVRFVDGGAGLASCSMDQSIRFWDLGGHQREIWGSPLALLSETPHVSMPKGVVWRKKGHRTDIADIDFSKDGRWALSASHRSSFSILPDDGTTARLWERKTGRRVCHLKGHRLGVTAVRFLPDGKRFVTASDDGTLRLYRVPTGPRR